MATASISIMKSVRRDGNADGRAGRGRLGMPPERVPAVVCLDNPRDNTRGKAYRLRCLY